jgi:NADPH:quinone reductase-like Zn-dependent oxidoreductase
MLGQAMDAVLEVFRAGGFRVVLGGSWPLARAGEAHAFLQSGKAAGKLVLV